MSKNSYLLITVKILNSLGLGFKLDSKLIILDSI